MAELDVYVDVVKDPASETAISGSLSQAVASVGASGSFQLTTFGNSVIVSGLAIS